MITSFLKQRQYEQLCHLLRTSVTKDPLDAAYTVPVTVDATAYTVKFIPQKHFRVAVLQAIQVTKTDSGATYTLITERFLLESLFRLFLHANLVA